MAEQEIPGIRPASLMPRAMRTDDIEMVKFGHVMSKELADKLDERCKRIGGISRRALMNVLLWEAFEGKSNFLTEHNDTKESVNE